MTTNGPRPARVPAGFPGVVAAVLLFGTAFGFIEAAVVIDLRAVYEPLRRSHHPEASPGELFPILTPGELARGPAEAGRLIGIEVAREAATMALLAGFGLAVGGPFLRRFAAFLAAFGVWDITFYLSLRGLIGWPASFWTWDLLFLIPAPWAGPVLAPLIAAATMAVCGLHTIARDLAGRPVGASWRGWLGVIAGGGLMVLAFSANAARVTSGGVPTAFPWPLFGLGEGVALAGYALMALGRRVVIAP